jgi:hypothetical protein
MCTHSRMIALSVWLLVLAEDVEIESDWEFAKQLHITMSAKVCRAVAGPMSIDDCATLREWGEHTRICCSCLN